MADATAKTETKILTLEALASTLYSKDEFWEGEFNDYLAIAQRQPQVAYSAYQRMYASIVRHGSRPYTFARDELIHYDFFDDLVGNGRDGVYGLDRHMMRLVEIMKAGAAKLGQERRITLLLGPVGSSKSTIARLLRRGLQAHTKTDEGKLYTFSWVANDDKGRELLGIGTNQQELACPMHEDPFMLLPVDVRDQMARRLNAVELPYVDSQLQKRARARLPEEMIAFEGEICPLCRFVLRGFLKRYEGDWKKTLQEHVRVKRLIFSEADRVGLGSFRPKDEKNQDSTELSGDLNLRKIAEYGIESDPRAFNFDGEFQVSHRGFFYAEELFKLDQAFLYDFLGATQEHAIKPKRFAEMHIDEVLMGGTNNPEYKMKVVDNDSMEALADRTTVVHVPYVVDVRQEVRIYRKVFASVPGGKHIAPHVIEMASLWAVLTRLKPPKKLSMSLLDKLRLYAGRTVPGFTEDHVRELMKEAEGEGMDTAASPRYVQDKIGDAIVTDADAPCVTPFAVFAELEEGLRFHSLMKGTNREAVLKLLSVMREEYDEVVKAEVQQAIASDEKSLVDLFNNYTDNVFAYINKEKVRNQYTGEEEPPNERLMREVESKIDVTISTKDDFRAKLVQAMATRQRKGQTFDYKSDERLLRALQLKLFDDRKDTVKLASLHSKVVDPEEQAKIDIAKDRLIKQFEYCEYCANVVMHHVASIFARGTPATN